MVVGIFNKVNSGGTKLSKGDLALAKICADWPEARHTMKAKLGEWAKADYHFNLDWLLRSVNTVLTGEAKFQFLHEKSAEEVQDGLSRATKHIDTCLNLISGRLGLDHDQRLSKNPSLIFRKIFLWGRLPAGLASQKPTGGWFRYYIDQRLSF